LANSQLQQITLTADELLQAGTLLRPAAGYEAIESVTLQGSWDYWYQGNNIYDVNGTAHGVLSLDSGCFTEAYPELWTGMDPPGLEIFQDPTTFNPVLASKNDFHMSSRYGSFTFRSTEADFYDPRQGYTIYLPEMHWRLVEASAFANCRQVLTQFNNTSLTASDVSSGVVLKFLGTAYPGCSYFGSRGSYYAYFVNAPIIDDPSNFYLLGLEATARGRMNYPNGDYVDGGRPEIINTAAATVWWSNAFDPCLYVKYLDQVFTNY
jgi:hypothetical protein